MALPDKIKRAFLRFKYRLVETDDALEALILLRNEGRIGTVLLPAVETLGDDRVDKATWLILLWVMRQIESDPHNPGFVIGPPTGRTPEELSDFFLSDLSKYSSYGAILSLFSLCPRLNAYFVIRGSSLHFRDGMTREEIHKVMQRVAAGVGRFILPPHITRSPEQ